MKLKKETSCKRNCRRVWCWLLMILVWALIIFNIVLAIYVENRNDHIFNYAKILLPISYVIYVITSFCSETFGYLFSHNKGKSIEECMKKLFFTPPTITWNIECYHYDCDVHVESSRDGTSFVCCLPKRVSTQTAKKNFKFHSWRDISGVCLLDSNRVSKSHKKVYAKLSIEQMIEFADDVTKNEYQRQKDKFYNKYKSRDENVTLSEVKYVPGLDQVNMVRISNERQACINTFIYVFFIIVPLLEFYKMYVEQFCVELDYKLTKVVSTRHNLHHIEYSECYDHLIPELAIFDKPRLVYNEERTLILGIQNLPSLDELDESKNFANSLNMPQENSISNLIQTNKNDFKIEEKVNVIQKNNVLSVQDNSFPNIMNYQKYDLETNRNKDINLNIDLKEKLI